VSRKFYTQWPRLPIGNHDVCLLGGECSKTVTMAKRLFYDLHASAGLFVKSVGCERLSGDCDTPDALKQAWYIEEVPISNETSYPCHGAGVNLC
jgi:hypothetical protein